MKPEGVQRRLAAVLSADMAGQTRMTEVDEQATLAAWRAARREIIDPAISAHRGRVVKHRDDGFLAEFGTAFDAVECAVAMRTALAARHSGRPSDPRLNCRFGISLGDVVIDGGDLCGDEIHVANCLKALAEPGGICVSGNIREQVHKKIDIVLADMGEQPVEPLSEPVRAYRIASGPVAKAAPASERRRGLKLPALAAAIAILAVITGLVWLRPWTPALETASIERMAFPLPDKPSIAVLPLDDMSGPLDGDHLGDGITENIITALSKVHRLFVIGRNSTFVYKGKPVKVQTVAEELGVRFVLEGNVQRSGQRVRITLQLTDALSGNHMWAEHYDRELSDLFAVQDEIARNVAQALEVKLTEGEQARAWQQQTSNWEAGDLLAQGSQLFYRFSKDGNAQAREKIGQALEIDPRFALAYAMQGWTHWVDALEGWSDEPEQSYGQALEAAQKALALDPLLPDVHALLGAIQLHSGDFEQAIQSAEYAVSLNPNHATNMALLGMILANAGRVQEGISRFKTAMRLSPYYPDWFLAELGSAYRFAEQYEDSAAAFEQYLERRPAGPMSAIAHAGLAVAYHGLGRETAARNHVVKALEIDPRISVVRMRHDSLYRDSAATERMLEILKQLGMPE